MEKINIDLQIAKMDFGSYSDTVKIHEAMKNGGVKNIEILCRCNEKMIADIGHFASSTMMAIKRVLATYGLKFDMTTEELDAYRKLPEDSFRNHEEVTLSDVEKATSDYYAALAQKSRIENEIEELLMKKQREENSFFFHRHEDNVAYEDIKEVRDDLKAIQEKLTQDVSIISGHANTIPSHVTNPLDLFQNLMLEKKTDDFEGEVADYVCVSDDKGNEIDVNVSHYADLLSKNQLVSLLDDSDSRILRHLFRKQTEMYYPKVNNLYDLCSRSIEDIHEIFNRTPGMTAAISVALKKYSLHIGMNIAELDLYQKMYDLNHEEPAPRTDEEDHQIMVDKWKDYDPIVNARLEDVEFMRLRFAEKIYCDQPWYIKFFCSENKRFKKAIKAASRFLDISKEYITDLSNDYFDRNYPVNAK